MRPLRVSGSGCRGVGAEVGEHHHLVGLRQVGEVAAPEVGEGAAGCGRPGGALCALLVQAFQPLGGGGPSVNASRARQGAARSAKMA